MKINIKVSTFCFIIITFKLDQNKREWWKLIRAEESEDLDDVTWPKPLQTFHLEMFWCGSEPKWDQRVLSSPAAGVWTAGTDPTFPEPDFSFCSVLMKDPNLSLSLRRRVFPAGPQVDSSSLLAAHPQHVRTSAHRSSPALLGLTSGGFWSGRSSEQKIKEEAREQKLNQLKEILLVILWWFH